jgi:hypothetical protein
VKDEYFGDVSDFWKYGILRVLTAHGLSVFVCWMLTAPASGRDGRKLGYLAQGARHRPFDPELFDVLGTAVRSGRRGVGVAEEGLVPGAGYYAPVLGDSSVGRACYFEGLWAAADGYDVVFFDADNGIERGVRKGRAGSHRYLYLDEIATTVDRGHTPLVFQHFTREPRAEFLVRTAERVRTATQIDDVIVVSTPHVAYFAAPLPSHRGRLGLALDGVAARPGSRVVPAS